MKIFAKYVSILLMVLTVGLVSCGSDDSGNSGTDANPVVTLADRVTGTYSGRLMLGGEVRQDAYIVTVTKLTDKTVKVSANFFGDKGEENFNLSESSNQILFTNSTISNFSMYVTGNSMVINYLSNGGNMLTYTGTK